MHRVDNSYFFIFLINLFDFQIMEYFNFFYDCIYDGFIIIEGSFYLDIFESDWINKTQKLNKVRGNLIIADSKLIILFLLSFVECDNCL